jgi:hypothetical protein
MSIWIAKGMATRKILTSVHDAWGFLRAYIAIMRARRLLERRGLKGAQRVMLRSWKTNSNITPDDQLITWVDKAVRDNLFSKERWRRTRYCEAPVQGL